MKSAAALMVACAWAAVGCSSHAGTAQHPPGQIVDAGARPAVDAAARVPAPDAMPAIASIYGGEKCAARAASLQTDLAAVIAQRGIVPPVNGFTAVAVTSAPDGWEDHPPDLWIIGGGVVIGDETVAGDAERAKRIDELLPAAKGTPFDVVLDEATPVAETIADLTHVSKQAQLRLVVAAPRREVVPIVGAATPAWAKTIIDDARQRGDSSAVYRGLSRAMGTCRAVAEAFGRMTSTTLPQLPRELSDGLAACACEGVDVDAVEAFVLMLISRSDPEAGTLEVKIAGVVARGGARLALPAGATAADLIAKLHALPLATRRAGVTISVGAK